MKAKQLYTILLTFILLMVIGCDDMPRKRPAYTPAQAVALDPDDMPDEEDDQTPQRPSSVYIQPTACGCLKGKAITYGSNCAAVCQSKGTGLTSATLYLTVKVGADIELTNLKDLTGWCTTPLIDPKTGEAIAGNPACVMEAKDEYGQVRTLNFTPVGNTASVVIDPLADDMTYRISIVETTSGVRSDTLQIRKVSTPITDPVMGPLRLMPVTQYTCMYISVADSDNGNEAYYDYATRLLYYFVPEVRPEALPEYNSNLYCHDIQQYGTIDRGGTRLEESPGAFTLWSRWDPRFYDTDNDGKRQIDQLIVQAVEDQGASIDSSTQLFFEFNWFSGPQFTSNSGSGSSGDTPSGDSLGYYMTPFVDTSSLKAYCPKQAHYYSNNQLFVAMRELVGVDTEGIYVAKKEGLDCTFMLINETQLKQIWFYKNSNGTHIQLTNNTVEGKKIQFYYPADVNSPFIKKSHQSLYTILSQEELEKTVCGDTAPTKGPANENSGGSSVKPYPPHDKRIGCVPVTSDD